MPALSHLGVVLKAWLKIVSKRIISTHLPFNIGWWQHTPVPQHWQIYVQIKLGLHIHEGFLLFNFVVSLEWIWFVSIFILLDHMWLIPVTSIKEIWILSKFLLSVKACNKDQGHFQKYFVLLREIHINELTHKAIVLRIIYNYKFLSLVYYIHVWLKYSNKYLKYVILIQCTCVISIIILTAIESMGERCLNIITITTSMLSKCHINIDAEWDKTTIF